MKCDDCPLKDSSEPCAAECLPNPRYCQLINPSGGVFHPAYIPIIIEASKNCGKKHIPPQNQLGGVDILTKGVNFGRAVWKVIQYGYVTPDDKIVEERLATCLKCPLLIKENECSVCGCNVHYKVQLGTESCPKGYWGAVQGPAPEVGKCGGCGAK